MAHNAFMIGNRIPERGGRARCSRASAQKQQQCSEITTKILFQISKCVFSAFSLFCEESTRGTEENREEMFFLKLKTVHKKTLSPLGPHVQDRD